MGRFDGTVSLVSGGARGMGAEHVRGLVAEGGKVVFGDVLVDEGKTLADELGDAVRFVELDVTQAEDWERAVAAADELGGPISLLVNNAGILAMGDIDTMSEADFRKVIDVNLVGVFLGMQAAIPSLRSAGGGTIINVSSTAGLMGYGGLGAYVASKWGVRGITKSAAMELGKDGIRVMSVHPGPIKTPMIDDVPDAVFASQPIARAGEPSEVTKLVLFLAADATYSTGSEFVVDGGQVLGPTVDLG